MKINFCNLKKKEDAVILRCNSAGLKVDMSPKYINKDNVGCTRTSAIICIKTCINDKKATNAKPLIHIGLAFLISSYSFDYVN
jgi:hypothetical protein